MNGPFFVLERGGDVIVFTTLKTAEQELEAIDVRNDEYRFFAEDGTELRLRRTQDNLVVTDEVIGKFPGDLADALRSWLQDVPPERRVMTDASIGVASLRELVDAVTRYSSTSDP